MTKRFEVVSEFKGAQGLTVAAFAKLLVESMKTGVIQHSDILVISDGLDSIRPVIAADKGEVERAEEPNTGRRSIASTQR